MRHCNSLYYIILSILILFVCAAALTDDVCADSGKLNLRLAFLPFQDTSSRNLDLKTPAMLKKALAGSKFLKFVPVEISTEKIYQIDPLILRTGLDGANKQGDIFWSIRPEIMTQVSSIPDADFLVSGILTGSGQEKTLYINVSERSGSVREMAFHCNVPDSKTGDVCIDEMAGDISGWLYKIYALSEAEEYIRRYKGRIDTYDDTVRKLQVRLKALPGSIPIGGLLLDMYIEKRARHEDEIRAIGTGLIRDLEHAGPDDIRYLLSLSLHPFDGVAIQYEMDARWQDAVELREKALKVFPYWSGVHRTALGGDYFRIAEVLEEAGDAESALVSYRKSLRYLSNANALYNETLMRINNLTTRDR